MESVIIKTTDYSSDELFNFEIRRLHNSLVHLRPFDVDRDSEILLSATLPHPDLFKYLSFGPWDTVEHLKQWYRHQIAPDPQVLWYTITDETRSAQSGANTSESQGKISSLSEDSFAGMIGNLKTSKEASTTEIGNIIILPKFQRTHVLTNAAGLMLQYALAARPHGLNIRRVVWRANHLNEPSIAAAKRLGFHFEGVIRWEIVLPASKSSTGTNLEREGDNLGPGRHNAMLSMCWDDWEGGKKDALLSMMLLRRSG